jgi:hypothetical protein
MICKTSSLWIALTSIVYVVTGPAAGKNCVINIHNSLHHLCRNHQLLCHIYLEAVRQKYKSTLPAMTIRLNVKNICISPKITTIFASELFAVIKLDQNLIALFRNVRLFINMEQLIQDANSYILIKLIHPSIHMAASNLPISPALKRRPILRFQVPAFLVPVALTQSS